MTVGGCVGSDVRERDEDSPFHHEDSQRDQSERGVFEGGEFGGDRPEIYHGFAGEASVD